MNSKPIKILVISNKGGVGKSTIAMQIATPYLYVHNHKKPIKYYEFDDENQDYLSFASSELSIRKSVVVSNNFLRDEITDIFSKNESICVDIGGNITTTIAIKAFRDTGMINLVDLVIIPLLDGEQDGINASIVYNTIKHLNPDIKVLFILNKTKDIAKIEYQFENYFGDPRGIFSEKYALKTYLKDYEFNNYACLLDDDLIKYSRRFGLTIYDLAKQKRDFITNLRKNMDRYTNESEIRITSFKNYIDHSSKDYYSDVIVPIFKKIDNILGR
jgi:hypothetical protein